MGLDWLFTTSSYYFVRQVNEWTYVNWWVYTSFGKSHWKGFSKMVPKAFHMLETNNIRSKKPSLQYKSYDKVCIIESISMIWWVMREYSRVSILFMSLSLLNFYETWGSMASITAVLIMNHYALRIQYLNNIWMIFFIYMHTLCLSDIVILMN